MSCSNDSKPQKLLFTALSAGLAGLLAACSSSPYSITFNDNVLYSPNGKDRSGILRDSALQACLNQVLAADKELTISTVTSLACPASGVETLEGITALERLEQLELSDNRISNLSPLGNLRNLRLLSLRNNQIGNIGILENLPILRFVSLEGNASIPCRQLETLKKRLGNTLNSPATCQ